jgi:hypothetical protein
MQIVGRKIKQRDDKIQEILWENLCSLEQLIIISSVEFQCIIN